MFGLRLTALKSSSACGVSDGRLIPLFRQVVLIGSLRGINDGIGMVVRCLEDPIHEVEPFRMTVLVPSDKVTNKRLADDYARKNASCLLMRSA